MMNENGKLMTANPLQIDTTFQMNWSLRMKEEAAYPLPAPTL